MSHLPSACRPLAFACVALLLSCFQSPPMGGPYRCQDDGTCADTALVCDDGICCQPGGTPACPSYVTDAGLCPDGGAPSDYYLDQDGDGFGNAEARRTYCIPPVVDPYISEPGDCNDSPAAGGQAIFPGAPEQCDGVDNDCDQAIDDGLTQQQFFLDEDGDTYGDPARPVSACAPPVGYVGNNLDCAPATNAIHPGATEVCNAIDDNCRDGVDESAPENGQACTDGSRNGVCQAGTRLCVNGTFTCPQSVSATTWDRCDGKDDDCDGSTDERPECGGPSLVYQNALVSVGAKRLSTYYSGAPSGCLKGAAGKTPDDTVAMPNLIWGGTGPESHVFWIEAQTGYWDLSQTGKKLKLRVEESITGPTTQVWDNHHQPVVLLCGRTAHLRYVHLYAGTDPVPMGDYLFPINDTYVADVNSNLPLRGGNGWVISTDTAGNLETVLREVKRIEVLVEPWGASTFEIDFYNDTFGFN